MPVAEGERSFDVAIDSTLRASLVRRGQDDTTGTVSLSTHDLRKKLFKRPRNTLIVFVVDASESMGKGTFVRMKAAKGAALAILAKARLARNRIAMVAFRDESAEVVLPPTSSLALAQTRLKTLPTGGATPLADGLMKAWRIVKTERRKDSQITPLLVVISDGDANVPFDPERKYQGVMEELFVIAQGIARDRIHSIAIDTRPTWEKSDNMRLVAQALNASYHHIDGLKAKNVVAFISSGASLL